MRDDKDILEVKLQLSSMLSLDWERIEQDPTWINVSAGIDLSVPEERDMALRRYISAYLGNEKLFRNCPSTNGPASIWALGMEIEDNGNSNTGTEAGAA